MSGDDPKPPTDKPKSGFTPQLVSDRSNVPAADKASSGEDETADASASSVPEMSSRTPYMVRAVYEWIVDNNMTPYMVVAAADPRVQVPAEHVKDGHILLNVAPRSVQSLHLGNDEIRFLARFSGVSREIRVPIWALRALYARENGDGMVFAEEAAPSGSPEPDPTPPSPVDPQSRAKPALRVVK